VLLDPAPRRFPDAQAALLLSIAALVTRDVQSARAGHSPGRQPRASSSSYLLLCGSDGDSDGGGAEPAATATDGAGEPGLPLAEPQPTLDRRRLIANARIVRFPPPQAGLAAAAVPRFAGVALVDAAAPGMPLLLLDDLFTKLTGLAPAAARGAGLWALLGVGPDIAARAAAAARGAWGFEVGACVAHRLGGAMHLKLTCAPAAAAAATPSATPSAPSAAAHSATVSASGDDNSSNSGSSSGGLLYLVAVDLLNAADEEMWLPGGAPRCFRELP
jgi:hypothetical protein